MTRTARDERWRRPPSGFLPKGTPLTDEDWAKRHRAINVIALLHVPAVLVYALTVGVGVPHALLETAPVAVPAVLGRVAVSTRLVRELATTLSLVVSSAVLVHLSGGYIELHFHFFVVVALVTLYQQWSPFLLAVGFVVLHHGVAGVLAPATVYNHPDALAHPWRWAVVHGAFIAMASAVGVTNWKLNELSRARAEDYFRQLYEGEHAVVQRLEEADRLKSELVAAVSHEFRTPLTAILGFSATLQQLPSGREELAHDFAGRIHRQGRRLQQLIENLLESERPFEPSAETCDAATVVAAAIEGARALDRDPERAFAVELDDGLALPLGREHARLVLDNLLGNAVKFAPPGTPVRLRGRRHGDGMVLSVSNAGRPIDPERLRRIFEPFVQGDSSNTRAADGVGLGLHIVKRVVTANGGGVRVTSDASATTFELSFPAPSERSIERADVTAVTAG